MGLLRDLFGPNWDESIPADPVQSQSAPEAAHDAAPERVVLPAKVSRQTLLEGQAPPGWETQTGAPSLSFPLWTGDDMSYGGDGGDGD
jgi:hypothetical protein